MEVPFWVRIYDMGANFFTSAKFQEEQVIPIKHIFC